MAIAVLCLNTAFELFFQYRFQTKIQAVYFIISAVISVAAVKDRIKNHGREYLPVFYCFWPAILLFIMVISECKLCLLPFAVSSFLILFYGRLKNKFVKIAIVSMHLIVLFLLSFWWLMVYWFAPGPNVLGIVYSPDNKYVMVLEETDFSLGGNTSVYFGRNIDFGILGCYSPRRLKYLGNTIAADESVEFHFVGDDFISINGMVIERKGKSYIDDYH